MLLHRHLRSGAALLAAGTLAAGSACGGDERPEPDQPAADQAEQRADAPAETPTQIAGGRTTLRLDATLRRVLDLAGVEVAPAGQARRTERGVAFPITGGRLDLGAVTGRVEHAGGLRFAVGGRGLEATELVVEPGEQRVTAQVAGRRIPILSLDPGRPRVAPTGDTVVLPASVGLAREAAQALNDRLGVGVFRAGLPLGEATVSARRR